MKNFTIEIEKWQWAEAVKSKNVYRDHEFVRANTKEEALESVHFLLKQPRGGNCYTITVERNGKYLTYFMFSMPCLGGLVKYSDTHGKDKYFMNPYFPRDIKVAFPEGNIIYIGVYRPGIKGVLNSTYNKFLLSEESPWVSAFNNKDTIIFEDNYLILTDMNTDPTIFYSLLRYSGGFSGGYGNNANNNINPKASLLLLANSYCDPRRLAASRPIRTSGGTWKQGYGYTRGYNESIWKTSIPVKDLKGFGELPKDKYPPTFNFKNDYFIKTMKEKFGVDVSIPDKKVYDALVESWSFFKEESKTLGSGFSD